jgi:hypothetical protein
MLQKRTGCTKSVPRDYSKVGRNREEYEYEALYGRNSGLGKRWLSGRRRSGMITSETARPPVPPFDRNAAIKKVRLAEDAWNTRNPEKVASGYTPDSLWRNRSEFFSGREAMRLRNRTQRRPRLVTQVLGQSPTPKLVASCHRMPRSRGPRQE